MPILDPAIEKFDLPRLWTAEFQVDPHAREGGPARNSGGAFIPQTGRAGLATPRSVAAVHSGLKCWISNCLIGMTHI